MRNSLFILLLCAVGTANGQILDYFGLDQEWLQYSTCLESEDCELNTDFVYYVAGDSDVVATGELYKEIRVRGTSTYNAIGSSGPGLCEGSFTFDYLTALLRQDGRKIISFDMNDEEEVMLYDFDLEIDDSLPVTPIQPFDDVLVTGIDSLSIAGGYYVRYYTLSTPSPSFLIEGVGSTFGFLENMWEDTSCTYSYGCYSVNDVVEWSYGGSACNFSVGIEASEPMNRLVIYPNPADNELYFQGLDDRFDKVQVYDQAGKLMIDKKLIDKTLDINDLKSGNYFIHLASDEALIQGRFVKLP